jgi:hypothetical protein
MASTYEKIATTTLGSAQATVTFSTISGAYTDLVLIAETDQTASSISLIRFNGDTGSNYSSTIISGTGSTVGSSITTNATSVNFTQTSANLQLTLANIMNYSNTTTYKTFLLRRNDTAGSLGASVGLWRSTSAITSIDLISNASTFLAGSTFTLYGILKA